MSATACSLAADVLQALLVCSPGVAAGASVAQVSFWLTDALAHAEGGKLASQVQDTHLHGMLCRVLVPPLTYVTLSAHTLRVAGVHRQCWGGS